MKEKIGSKFIREVCIAGAAIDVTIKYSARADRRHRSANCNPSREAVIKNNDRLAAKKLTRLINANFYPGDYHCTMTYAGEEPSTEEARREIDNFKRRMAREYKKRGKEFKWIEVTEHHNHRIHHHMVLNYIDETVIAKQWRAGHVRFVELDRTRNYKKLAEYLIKETTKTMRMPGAETKQRWSASRNLTRPIIKREIVDPRVLYQTPKALKGYQIVGDSINRFEHPFTKIEHLEYMMISTDPVPRIKTWRQGKIIKRDETYKRASEIQIAWEDLDGIDFD